MVTFKDYAYTRPNMDELKAEVTALIEQFKVAETFDKFTRNEVASSNEMRSVLGWRPSNDPRADELRNKNLNAQEGYEPIYTENNEEGGSGSGAGGISDVGKMKLSELRNMLGK